MIINQTIGNLNENPTQKNIDYLDLEWFETTKRIQRKRTRESVSWDFLNGFSIGLYYRSSGNDLVLPYNCAKKKCEFPDK